MFGPYRLQELIGRGGMGEIYRAYDTARGRVVALKRLPAALAADPVFQARFRSEAALAARLREPHVIPIHDFGEIDGQLYIDMRLVEGPDLAHPFCRHAARCPPRRVVDIVTQVASALDAVAASAPAGSGSPLTSNPPTSSSPAPNPVASRRRLPSTWPTSASPARSTTTQ